MEISPSFFKLIVDPLSEKLRIPEEFTRRYGKDLPDSVFFKVPCASKLWKIDLIRDDNGDIWFSNGWKEFKEHYSLQILYLLVFQFDAESSKFDVWIFDITATQIDYPLYHQNSAYFLERISEEQNDVRCAESADQLDGSRIGTPKSFTRQLMICNAHRILLPREFTEGTDITTDRDVTLLGVNGRKCTVPVNYKKGGTYEICSGWNNFLKENNVIIGSKMSFTLVPSSDNVIETRIVEWGTNKNNTFNNLEWIGGRYKLVASAATRDNAARRPNAVSSSSTQANEYESHDSRVYLGKISKPRKCKEKIAENISTVQMTGRKRRKTGGLLESPLRRSARKVKRSGTVGGHTETTENEECSNDQGGGSGTGMSWEFTKRLTIYNANRIVLPREFTESTVINTDSKIMVRDLEARMWPVSVIRTRPGTYAISGGWNNFLKNNDIIIGSIISLTFVQSSHNIIDARVVERGTDKRKLFKFVKRIGGRFTFIASLATRDHARRPKTVPSSIDHVNDEGNEYESHDSVVLLGDSSRSQKGKKKFVKMTGRKKLKTSNLLDNPVKRSAWKVKRGVDGRTETTNNEESFNAQGGGCNGSRSGFTRKLMAYNAYKLVLPRAFTERTGITADSEVMVRDEKARTWPVSVIYVRRGRYDICRGWNDFLTNNDVTIGSTILCTFIPGSNNIIEVQVVQPGADKHKLFKYVRYRGGSNGAKRLQIVSSTVDNEKDYRTTEQETGPRAGRIWKYSMKMKKYHKLTLEISKSFAVGTGIASGRSILLKDGNRKLWPVDVFFSNTNGRHRYHITTGWNDFLVGNKVAEGNTVELKHTRSSGNVIEARVLKNGRKVKLFTTKARTPSSKAK